MENLFYYCLGYCKFYCKYISIDFDYVYNLVIYLEKVDFNVEVLKYVLGIEVLLGIYCFLDWLFKLFKFFFFNFMLMVCKLIK